MNIKSVFFGWDARDGRTAIVGVIFLFLTIYFEPISGYVVAIVLYISNIISSVFTNNLYYTASGDPESGITLAIYFLLMVFCALFIIRPKFLNKFNRGDDHTQNIKLTGRYKLIMVSVHVIFTTLICSMYTAIFTYFAFPIVIHNSFYKDVRIISPSISDSQKSMLISRWSSMHSASDYEAIRKSIDDAKAKIPPVP